MKDQKDTYVVHYRATALTDNEDDDEFVEFGKFSSKTRKISNYRIQKERKNIQSQLGLSVTSFKIMTILQI